MNYISLIFTCKCKSEGHFPLYQGSMLRGAMGNGLRRALCMGKEQECSICPLSKTCIFPKLFAPSQRIDRQNSLILPPPFCIEPAFDTKNVYAKGESFTFGLKLFSYALSYLPFFLHAFLLAGEHGIGKGISEGFGRFEISQITQNGNSVYDASRATLLETQVQELHLPALCPCDTETSLSLTLETPLRFKRINRLSSRLEFWDLIQLFIRRMCSLLALEGKTYHLPDGVFSRIKELALSVRTESQNFAWRDLKRFSGRQQTTMEFGGLTGHICYLGPVLAFSEYLRLAEIFHLGKQTSFGLGKIACSYGTHA